MSTTEPWMCGDAFANVRPKPHRSSPVRLIPSGNSHLALPLKQRSDHWYDAILVHYHSSLQIQKAEEPLPLATSPSEEQLGFRVTCKFRLPGTQGQMLPSKVTSDSRSEQLEPGQQFCLLRLCDEIKQFRTREQR